MKKSTKHLLGWALIAFVPAGGVLILHASPAAAINPLHWSLAGFAMVGAGAYLVSR